MGKKLKFDKLKKQGVNKEGQAKSVFNNFASKIQKAKQKKIQKLSQTKERVTSAKKNNKLVRLPPNTKKAQKFALLDDEVGLQGGLTHGGKSIKDLKHFNDMYFGGDDEESDNNDMHDEINFDGFENKGSKSKKEVYQQIIQKSRSHKKERQQQYEENLNVAVDLDQQFPNFISNLKFRNRDMKIREKIENKDVEYDKLVSQLKDDERVVANRVVDNKNKGAEKAKRHKNQQLCKLMQDQQDDADIRGWVNDLSEESNNEEINSEEDQLDEVQLSSGDQQEDEEDIDEDEQDFDEEEQEQDDEDEQQQSESSSPKQIKQKIIKKNKIPKIKIIEEPVIFQKKKINKK